MRNILGACLVDGSGLTQYKVTWEGHELLVYAKNPADARFQVGAPATATVEESFLAKRDIKKLLMK